MDGREEPSNRSTIVQAFEEWLREFLDDVLRLYLEGDGDRLQVALAVWEDRFTAWLQKTIPTLVPSYEIQTSSFIPISFYGDPLEGFKALRAKPIRAFLDQCISSARGGQFDDYLKTRAEQDSGGQPHPEPGKPASGVGPNPINDMGPLAVWDAAYRKIMLEHFNQNLRQARIIFWISVVVMASSALLVAAGVSLTYVYRTSNYVTTSLIAAVSEFVGATFLYMHSKITEQAESHLRTIERLNAVSMASKIIDSMPDAGPGSQDKSQAKAALVEQLARQGRSDAAVERRAPRGSDRNA